MRMPWSARFDDPIMLPNGRKSVTLKDAANYNLVDRAKVIQIAGAKKCR